MNREIHVRICEGLRGKFPRPTRRAPRAHFKYKVCVTAQRDEGMLVPRSRLAGAGFKAPQAACGQESMVVSVEGKVPP